MKKYEITKEQILELSNESSFTKATLNKWFPEVFETKLETGKWYFQTDSKALVNYQSGISGFGFASNGIWNDLIDQWSFKSHKEEWIEATEQEVKIALENEAVKRGFKEGNYKCLYSHEVNEINSLIKIYCMDLDRLWIESGVVYENGKWAEIITTLTKKEAEEKLNCKII